MWFWLSVYLHSHVEGRDKRQTPRLTEPDSLDPVSTQFCEDNAFIVQFARICLTFVYSSTEELGLATGASAPVARKKKELI